MQGLRAAAHNTLIAPLFVSLLRGKGALGRLLSLQRALRPNIVLSLKRRCFVESNGLASSVVLFERTAKMCGR